MKPHNGILVVDDTLSNLKLLAGILSDEGYYVRRANSGEIALFEVSRELPELILLDIRMPEMDGYDVCKRIKQNNSTKDIPVLFISSAADTSDLIRGFEVGCADFISHPFQREELIARIRIHLELSRLQRRLEKTVRQRTFELKTELENRKFAEREVLHLKNYLSNIIDSMPSILVGLDKDGNAVLWNRQAEAMTGITEAEAVGHPVTQLLVDFASWIKKMFNDASNRQPVTIEKLLIERNRERFFYDLMLYPLITNEIDGSVLMIEDVTERTRIQELIIQTEKMMSVGGLAAGMAHEINNPLGIITQAVQNIERRLMPELSGNQIAAAEAGLSLSGLQEYLIKREIPLFIRDIKDASFRASRIINSFLHFSRRSDSIMQPASLIDVMDQAIELASSDFELKKKFDFRSVNIVREYENDLCLVPMIVTEMEQVFLNLLKNAAQAMADNPEDRKPKILIRLRNEDKYVFVEIEDNGPGMTEDIRLRVFEPFFTTKEPGAGTGLGLSVSYTIVTHNHKGVIDVSSLPGYGTSFSIRLPHA